MWVNREDNDVLTQGDIVGLSNQYYEKFGEDFIEFNYADFHCTETKCSGEVYLDALREALTKDEPTESSPTDLMILTIKPK